MERCMIGYVPTSFNLTDDTLGCNILLLEFKDMNLIASVIRALQSGTVRVIIRWNSEVYALLGERESGCLGGKNSGYGYCKSALFMIWKFDFRRAN